MQMTREEFEKAIIGQDDDGDYSESGYVAIIHNGVVGIARYSHCSCYGTFDSLCGGGISDYLSSGEVSLDWEGTPEQLKEMAERIADPVMPQRDADSNDYDFDHLVEMYSQVKGYFDAKIH